jgi:hypothetical protein
MSYIRRITIMLSGLGGAALAFGAAAYARLQLLGACPPVSAQI